MDVLLSPRLRLPSSPKKELPCRASERPVEFGVKRKSASELWSAVLGVLGLKPPAQLMLLTPPTARGSGPDPGSFEGVITNNGSRTVCELPGTSESFTVNM